MITASNYKKQRLFISVLFLGGIIILSGCSRVDKQEWRDSLAENVELLGHRNWILIADSAYPFQSRAGIETIATGRGQIEVVEAVLKAVEDADHVKAKVYLDKEIVYVPEENAPGITSYRKELKALLADREVSMVPHEELIAKLDEAAKTFRVFVLKTNLILPYTSVFLELDCGYWDSRAEAELRKSMEEDSLFPD
jgi:D-ribose pyranose/furanose isomerase RbsD